MAQPSRILISGFQTIKKKKKKRDYYANGEEASFLKIKKC
jgi:hypothetical protein